MTTALMSDKGLLEQQAPAMRILLRFAGLLGARNAGPELTVSVFFSLRAIPNGTPPLAFSVGL